MTDKKTAWEEGFEAGHRAARAVNEEWPFLPKNPYVDDGPPDPTKTIGYWAFRAGKSEASLWAIARILKSTEEACDKYDEDDVVTCGWKRSVQSIRHEIESWRKRVDDFVRANPSKEEKDG